MNTYYVCPNCGTYYATTPRDTAACPHCDEPITTEDNS